MTQLNPYLAFAGNCRAAMNFYKECLGGELIIQTVGESPMDQQMPGMTSNNVMHASLTKDSLILLASDMMGSEKAVQGNTISLCLNCSSEEEINTFFKNLSAGGTVTQPLTEAFWGATFGMLTDKFGFNWMLNYMKKPQ
ncbi:MAG: VOC family protein [Candidatus Abawacabacteria bacterium]|nr:VOC family protein [Candidatus Abawacabacteria bacterium]